MTGVIAVVTDDAALADLEPAWASLWRAVPGASPFQHPDWLLAWWRRFGNGQPVVATLHRDGAFAGVLACYRFADAAGSRLLPIGVSLSGEHDVLLAPRPAAAGPASPAWPRSCRSRFRRRAPPFRRARPRA